MKIKYNFYTDSQKTEKETLDALEKEDINPEGDERRAALDEAKSLIADVKDRRNAQKPDPAYLDAFKILSKKAIDFARWMGCNLLIQSDDQYSGIIHLSSECFNLGGDTPDWIMSIFRDLLGRADTITCMRGAVTTDTVCLEMEYIFQH